MNVSTVQRFYANMCVLLDILKDITPGVYEIQNILAEIKHTLSNWDDKDKEKCIELFIKKSIPYWNQKEVINKENTFLQNKGDYIIIETVLKCSNLTKTEDKQINILKQIFEDTKVNQEDVNIIWKFFIIFIKQGIKYIHEKRAPEHKIINHIYMPKYKNSYMNNIDLSLYTKQWNVKLMWNVSK